MEYISETSSPRWLHALRAIMRLRRTCRPKSGCPTAAWPRTMHRKPAQHIATKGTNASIPVHISLFFYAEHTPALAGMPLHYTLRIHPTAFLPRRTRPPATRPACRAVSANHAVTLPVHNIRACSAYITPHGYDPIRRSSCLSRGIPSERTRGLLTSATAQ